MSSAQTNMLVTNSEAEVALRGYYDPAEYSAVGLLNNERDVICGLNSNISADSLMSYFTKLNSFQNRNTYSDTTSSIVGIGATRRWVFNQFEVFSKRNKNRLITSYMKFDWADGACGPGQFKNVLAVLPGTDTSDKSIIVIESFMDNSSGNICDVKQNVSAQFDKASSAPLVLELARVMSKFAFSHTIVFLVTVGNAQGNYGAHAFAKYCAQNKIQLRLVQSNKMVGVCSTLQSESNLTDSATVNLIPNGNMGGLSGGYARYVKMIYEEKMKPFAKVAMTINCINQENLKTKKSDFPYGNRGFTSVSFSSLNTFDNDLEDSLQNGNQGNLPGKEAKNGQYEDEGEVGGLNFNYLKRITLINGLAASLQSMGPEIPAFKLVNDSIGLKVRITNSAYDEYRLGLRSISNSSTKETVYAFMDTSLFLVPNLKYGVEYGIRIASLDANGIMSSFSAEKNGKSLANTAIASPAKLPYSVNCFTTSVESAFSELLEPVFPWMVFKCRPNPFKKTANFMVLLAKPIDHEKAEISVFDVRGKILKTLPIVLKSAINDVEYHHTDTESETINCILFIDGQPVKSEKLIFPK